MGNDVDGSNSIYFCELCSKPITNESAFKRHVAYCRRTFGQPKKRKRSCKQCHRAKAKCSFEPQCSRCISKGFRCEYERATAPLASSETSKDSQDVSTPELSGSSPSDYISSPSHTFMPPPDVETLKNMYELQAPPPPRSATEIRTDPRYQASVLVLLDLIRGLPYALSRRETFPVFIHGQWHMPELPLTLSNCIHIAQLYIARDESPQGRELFYSTMNEERTRLMHQLSTATREELLASLAMQEMYTLLPLLDNESSQPNVVSGLEVQETDIERITCTARQCFAFDAYGPFDIDKIGDPNETWEEFIYSESRRRAALFWFILSRVVDLKYGAQCPPIVGYRGLALPAPGILWSARTEEEWEAARAQLRERCREPVPSARLRTLGDLIDIRACGPDPSRGAQLSNWLINCDTLGVTLMIASTMA